jgi:hypothetical protein
MAEANRTRMVCDRPYSSARSLDFSFLAPSAPHDGAMVITTDAVH